MTFTPEVNIYKCGDRLTVAIRQRYNPRGAIDKVIKTPWGEIEKPRIAYRWRIAGVFSLRELIREEK